MGLPSRAPQVLPGICPMPSPPYLCVRRSIHDSHVPSQGCPWRGRSAPAGGDPAPGSRQCGGSTCSPVHHRDDHKAGFVKVIGTTESCVQIQGHPVSRSTSLARAQGWGLGCSGPGKGLRAAARAQSAERAALGTSPARGLAFRFTVGRRGTSPPPVAHLHQCLARAE